MKKITISLLAAVVLAFAPAAVAQSLQTYFNFTTYGIQSGGAALADLTGHTTATLNTEAHTTLTSSGLTISSGGVSTNTGVTIGSAAMSGFTGAFSIQQWVTLAAVNNNQVLFGANNGDINLYVGDGITISTLIGAIRSQAFSAYVGGRTPSYVQGGYGVADGSGTPPTATLYDVVLTYDGTSFREYVNGTLKGTLNMPTFGSLAQACLADNWGNAASTGKGGFVIGGAMNDPFTDATLPETTSDFLLYNGALNTNQIITLHALGAGASLSAITNVFAPSASKVWSGGGSDNTWTNVANWVSGSAPNGGDFVTFAGTTQTNVNLVANFNLGSLTFSNNAGSFSITNSSSTLTLAGGLTNNSANLQTVAVPVGFSGAQTINAAAGNVALTGGVSGSGLTIVGNGRMVTLSGANTYTGSVAIQGSSILVLGNTAAQTNSGAVTGTGTLVMSGAGTLVLAGTNNFTGTTTVSNGTLLVTQVSGQSLGTNITVVGGATFGITASADASYLSPATMTVGNGGGATLQFVIVGTNNAPLKPATLTLSGTTTINITQCPYALTNFPLFTGYTAGALALGSQPTGWTGQLTVSGGTVYYTVTSLDPNLKPFVHPGCLSTLADLQRMKAKVQAGLEPWASGYAALANNSYSANTYVASPHPTPCRGSTCAVQDYLTMCRDANAAYQAALRYWITGDSSYADCAIRNMDGYANTVVSLEGDSNVLLMMGAQGFQWACAAELLRNYQPWINSGGFANFQNFLLTKFYMQPDGNGLSWFLQNHNGTCWSHYWLNWDLFAIDAVAAIGVVCDRRDIYNQAITYYQSGPGNGNAHNALYFMHPGYLGQSQEIGRDAGHSSADPILLGQFCEVAWNQGDDMYGYNNNTCLAISEYTDNMMTTWWNTPWVNYAGCDAWDTQVAFGTQYRPGADLIWNHYVNRKGLAAPFTMPWAIAGEPEGGGGNYGQVSGGFDQIGFTTLTHALDPITNSPAPSGVVADARNANEALVWWWGSAYATSYKVKRSTSINGPFTQVGTVAGNWTLLFTDYCLTPGTTYYYVVSAVVNGVETTNSLPASVLANQRLTGWVIGTSGSVTYGQGIAQLFDNAPITFFDAPTASGCWGGLDLGAPYVITQVGYYPRANFAYRMTGGQFQGCNVADFSSGVVTLYTIGSQPADGTTTVQTVSNPGAFRYVRYIGPDNGYCNAAEIQFQGYPSPALAPSAPTGLAAAQGSAQVALTWNGSAGVTGFNVKRAATSGGPYTQIATNLTAAYYVDTNVLNYTTYYYVVTAINATGESGNSSEVSATPSDMAFYYKFDESSGTTAADASGNGNIASLMSGATWTTGIISNAVHCDGTTNGYLTLPTGVVNGISDFTASAWVKTDVSSMWARVFDFGSGTGNYMFLTPVGGTGTVRYEILTPGNSAQQLNSPSAISVGAWHHLAVTLSGTTGILYVDGVAVTTNSSMTLNPSSLGGTTQNYLGKSQFPDPNLTGSVDDFRFYTHALKSSEVLALALTPSIPGGLTAVPVPGNTQVALSWNAVSGATSYNLKRAPVSGGSYTTVTNIAGTSFTDTGLVNLTTYYYVVSAVMATGETPNSAEVSATPYNSAPPVPLNLTATPGNGRVTLRWNPALTASGYKLWRSTTSGSGYAQIGSPSGTSYLDLAVTNGAVYYYVVSATNNLGASATSAEANATPHLITVVWSGALDSIWNSTSTNWLDGGTSTLYQDADTVTFDDSATGATTISIPAAVTPLRVNVNNNVVSYAIGGSAICGTGSLVKSGYGTLALNSANTFSGGTTNNGGAINLGNAGALGTGPLVLNGGGLGNLGQMTFANNIVIGGGANAIQLASGNNLTLTGTLSGNGSLTLGNDGDSDSLYLSGTNTMSGGMVLVAGNANYVRFASPAAGNANVDWLFLNTNAWQTTFDFGSGTINFGSLSGNGGMQGNVIGSMNVTLQVGGNNNPATFSGVINDNGTGTGPIGLTKIGTGIQWLTGACDYSGATVVTNGELVISTALAGMSSCWVSNGATLGVTNLSSSPGTISNLTLAAGSTLELMNMTNQAVPFLTGSNVVVSGVCTVKVTQAASTIAQGTYPLVNYAGQFQGSFANLQLQLPSGISGVLVSNANQMALSITTVIAPPAPATLTAIAGDTQVMLNWSSVFSATGYNIWRSTTSGSGYSLVGGTAGASYTDTGLVNNQTYYYVVTATNISGASGYSPQASATPQMSALWTGATNANWDFTTLNWSRNGTAATYANIATARFDDTAKSNFTINVATTVSPMMMVVSNSVQTYAFSGSSIAGTGNLSKWGSQPLTMSGANTYSGGTTNYSGSIVLGASSTGSGNSVTSGPLGTGTVTLSGGTVQMNAQTLGNNLSVSSNTTTIVDNSVNNGTFSGNVTGSGTITIQNSSGTSLSDILNGDWSGFTGTVNYNASVGIRTINLFAQAASGTFVATNSIWNLTSPSNTGSRLSAGNAGTTNILLGALSGPSGYLDDNNFGAGNLLTFYIGYLNTSTTFGGIVENQYAGTTALTKVGTGTLTLTGANTYTGSTTVSNGTLLVTTVSAAKGNYTVANSATFGVTNVSGGSALVSNLTVAAGSTLNFQNVTSTTTPLIAASNVTVNGSCTVKLTGANGLVAGNSYPLVSYAGTLSGSFANLQLQMPYGWRGVLANPGKQIVLTNVAVVSTTTPQLSLGVSNSLMQFNWPSDHTGWRLQVQANSPGTGLGTNWVDVPNTSAVNAYTNVINPANGSTFYRMVYP
jgi:autotransporter-associated beta strand protein